MRIFEALLSGRTDAPPLLQARSDGTIRPYDALEPTIGRIFQLFDPWTTPAGLLPWLAQRWFGLSFPDIWDDYQRRKVTSQIAQIYERRGLKEGLNTYLELYNGAARQPRISVDDGCKILFAKPDPGSQVSLDSLVSQGVSARYSVDFHSGQSFPTIQLTKYFDGMVAPLCMTLAADGSLFVGDAGTPGSAPPQVTTGIWHILPTGKYDFAGAPPRPQRLNPANLTLQNPVALAVDNGMPWNLYVLDGVQDPSFNSLWQIPSPGFSTATHLATKADLGTKWPVAMALDTNGHLLILDRGASVAAGQPSAPFLIDVQLTPTFKINPPLKLSVLEPLSLLVLPNNDLVIGDAREQTPAAPATKVPPADLVYVNRGVNPPTFTRLLADLPPEQNPLVAPVGLACPDPTQYYVLDLGLKAYAASLDPNLKDTPFCRSVAQAATVFRVALNSTGPPAVTRACTSGQLVYPTDMVLSQGVLYVCDRGEYSSLDLGQQLPRVWRALPHEIGITVYFSETDPKAHQRQLRQILQNIRDIVSREKPAHCLVTILSNA